MKKFCGCDHFLLDEAPLFCNETIAEAQWYACSRKTTPVLWLRVYGTRGVADTRGGSQLRKAQSDGVGSYDMRTAQLEESHWPVEGYRRPATAGAVGKSGDFGASSQKVAGHDPIPKEHIALGTRSRSQRTCRQGGTIYPDRCRAGAKPAAAAAGFPGACQWLSLSWIRDALWCQAAIPVLREPAEETSGRMHAVFESGLAHEASG
jgi:hypothetical protein